MKMSASKTPEAFVLRVFLFHFSPKLDHKFMFATLDAPKWFPAAAYSVEVCLKAPLSHLPRFCSDDS